MQWWGGGGPPGPQPPQPPPPQARRVEKRWGGPGDPPPPHHTRTAPQHHAPPCYASLLMRRIPAALARISHMLPGDVAHALVGAVSGPGVGMSADAARRSACSLFSLAAAALLFSAARHDALPA